MLYKTLLALFAGAEALKLNYPAEHQLDTSPYDPNTNKVTGYNIKKPTKADRITQDLLKWLQ